MKVPQKSALLLSSTRIRKLKAGTILALVALIITCVVGYTSFQRIADNLGNVKHTYEVKMKLEEFLSAVKDANRGMSGVLIRKDYSFYPMYRLGKESALKQINELKKLTADNNNQQKNLQQLNDILTTRFACLDSILVTNASNNEVLLKQEFSRSRILMDSMEKHIEKIKFVENALLTKRSSISQDSIEHSKVIITIFIVVSLLIIIVCFYLLFRSLEMIQENEKRYRAIFEYSNDLKCICNKTLTIIEANPQFIKTLVTKKRTTPLQLIDFFYDDTELEETKRAILAGENIKRKQLTFIGDDNKKFSCITNFVLIDKKRGIYSVILTDISEQLRLQDEKDAMENFANIGRVSRLLAHEVRNPLTNINLAVEGLQDENKNESLNTYFEIIERNSQRISKLITELLNSTKPNILEYEDINFGEFLNDVLLLTKDRIQLNHIKIVGDIPVNLPLFKGDKEKLTIAFLNIIINAIEAMPKEKGELVVEAFTLANKLIHINIGDNGIGMDAVTADNIFKPFFTKKQSGSGLGLATAQNIILMHKGKIGVNSTLGKGTIFTVQLPLV